MDNDTLDNSTGTATVLPKLLSICREIDKLFSRYVGPIAAELCGDALAAWTLTGRKSKPTDVLAYIQLLSVHIPHTGQRLAFENDAKRSIKLTN